MGIPWRLALRLTDEQGWILRNSIVWNKVKGGLDNTQDRLGNVHEDVFHFVKQPNDYYYNADAIRSTPRQAKVVNGAIVSATGSVVQPYIRRASTINPITPSTSKIVPRIARIPIKRTSRNACNGFCCTTGVVLRLGLVTDGPFVDVAVGVIPL